MTDPTRTPRPAARRRLRPRIAAALAAALFVTGCDDDDDPAAAGGAAAFEVAVTNLTTGQTFSPSLFATHNTAAPPFFRLGQPASFGLARIAEEGNPGPMSSAVVVPGLGGAFGQAVDEVSILPGQTRTVRVEATAAHPLLSAAWMLVQTNDGFTGLDAVNLLDVADSRTLELVAYDAGTERNNERNPYLIARMGLERDPEAGVVAVHPGVRGDADAPASWRFADPVARVVIRRVR